MNPGQECLQIRDGDLSVWVAPSFGNIACSMQLGGREWLWTPANTIEEWRPLHKTGGIPMLAPWANRLDQDAFYANGKLYRLNAGLGNLRRDGNGLPIHGLILFSSGWKTMRHDAGSVTSRLEFWRHPDWMAQFPFAHALEVTHRVSGGSLEIETAVENFAEEPMPLSLGYHPYMQLTDSPRDQWAVQIAAREKVVLSDQQVPNGAKEPIKEAAISALAGHALDDVFTNLTGQEFSAECATQRITVRFGPRYPVAIIYAPPGGQFICFEPMASQTNAFNLAHAGVAANLQSIAPGETWKESFWITPSLKA